MRTAMIDVGIDLNTVEALTQKTCFFEVCNNSVCTLRKKSCEPLGINHGGYCLAFFEAGANRPADCFVLLKQDEFGKSNVDDLVTALAWCIEHDIRLISLSMGTAEWQDAEKLANIAGRISQKGIILVAGAANDRNLTYPACFGSCIGVCVDYTEAIGAGCFSYMEKPFDGIEVILSPLTGKGELIGNNSVATAYFAGKLARARQNGSDIKKWLEENAIGFPARNMYSYARNGIQKNYNDDVIIVSCSELSNRDMIKYYRKLQAIFLSQDYHCLSVCSSHIQIGEHEVLGVTHCYPQDFCCSYEEYVRLMIQLCRPNLVLVERELYRGQCEADVLLYLSELDESIAQGDRLMICACQYKPQEAAEMIIAYFS